MSKHITDSLLLTNRRLPPRGITEGLSEKTIRFF